MAAFTAVAAGVGLVMAAGTTTASFIQAADQKDKQKKAEADAAEAMASARKRTEVNFYEELAVNKEAYTAQREAMLSAGAQAIEAGKESQRGLAAAVSRTQKAQEVGQAKIRQAEIADVNKLEQLVAKEESRLRDVNIQLDLGEAAGAQVAAQQFAEQSEASTMQGVKGIGQTVEAGLQMVPLYKQNKAVKGLDKAAEAEGVTTQNFLKTKAEEVKDDAGKLTGYRLNGQELKADFFEQGNQAFQGALLDMFDTEGINKFYKTED